jgi:hypothetical protein
MGGGYSVNRLNSRWRFGVLFAASVRGRGSFLSCLTSGPLGAVRVLVVRKRAPERVGHATAFVSVVQSAIVGRNVLSACRYAQTNDICPEIPRTQPADVAFSRLSALVSAQPGSSA